MASTFNTNILTLYNTNSFFLFILTYIVATTVHDVSGRGRRRVRGGASKRAVSFSGSITASPPTRPALHHRRARCVRIADTRTDHCKATTVRPSVRLSLCPSGIMASKCPKCDKTVYFGECCSVFLNPSPARRVSRLLSSFVPVLSNVVILFRGNCSIILAEFTKNVKLRR